MVIAANSISKFKNSGIDIPPLWSPVIQYKKTSPKVGRNQLCPCGSNLKFKRCCGNKKLE
ncbi:MAG: SEC-C metal-binding domain-containing protein [Elusimicrobia bacterium]|nr:SEC-C metal-binding domain-containing protein [Elusimicrobiota bacterium]